MPDISIIIPVYNEEKNIYKLHERLTDIIQKMQLSYEFIFVNDGSRDNSLNLVKGLHPPIRISGLLISAAISDIRWLLLPVLIIAKVMQW